MSATIELILNGQNYAWKNVLIWKGEVEGGNHWNKKDMIFPISSTQKALQAMHWFFGRPIKPFNNRTSVEKRENHMEILHCHTWWRDLKVYNSRSRFFNRQFWNCESQHATNKSICSLRKLYEKKTGKLLKPLILLSQTLKIWINLFNTPPIAKKMHQTDQQPTIPLQQVPNPQPQSTPPPQKKVA